MPESAARMGLVAAPVASPGVLTLTRHPARLWRRLSSFHLFLLFLISGYLIFGRAFAYFGVAGFYPGELILLITAFGSRGWIRLLVSAVRLRPALAASILLFLAWGCVECIRGFLSGLAAAEVLRGFATHYYTLLLFAGLSLGRFISADNLKRWFAWMTVATGLWGIVFTVAYDRGVAGGLPWAPSVPIFDGPPLPQLGLVLYLALSRRLRGSIILICLPAAVALFIGGRGAILAAVLSLAALILRPGRSRLVLQIGFLATAAIVGLALFSGLVPNLGGRTARATPSWVAARVISVVNPDLASGLIEGSDDVDGADLIRESGTADWRRQFWAETIASLDSPTAWLAGHGYGVILGDLVQDDVAMGQGVRTPHNFAIYLLGYTGLIGCALFLGILVSIACEVAKTPPSFMKDAIIVGGVGILVLALSGNLFETPIGAVPVYLTIGMMISVAQKKASPPARVVARGSAVTAA